MKWLLAVAGFFASTETWYERKLEGWYYFQENAQPEEQGELIPETAHEILEEEKQQLQQYLSLAVLDPTEAHVEQYLRAQKRWLDQSAHFASIWRDVHEAHPELGTIVQEQP